MIHCILSPFRFPITRALPITRLALATLAVATIAQAEVTTVALYRFGEQDPAAVGGQPAGATTTDAVGGHHLSRVGEPFYTSNVAVSARERIDSRIGVVFNGFNQG